MTLALARVTLALARVTLALARVTQEPKTPAALREEAAVQPAHLAAAL